MTKTRTLRAKTPADLLAMVPYVLGFHPEDSIVVLTLGAGKDTFHARVDLPHDLDDLPDVVESLLDPITRHAVRRVVVVVYCADTVLARQVSEPLCSRLEASAVEVVEKVHADGERWFSLTGCTMPCCPPEGTPYDLGSHPFTAQSVLEGQVTLRSRQELVESLVGNDPDAVDRAEAAADRHLERFELPRLERPGRVVPAPERVRAHAVQEAYWVRDRVRRYLTDGERLDDDDVGRMLVAVAVVEVRDVAWAEMSRFTARRHVALWRDLVRRSPHDLVAAPAGLLGFAAWLDGDGALAWCAVERCQDSDPDYRLAGLLTEALSGAVPPSSWRPFDGDALPLFAG